MAYILECQSTSLMHFEGRSKKEFNKKMKRKGKQQGSNGEALFQEAGKQPFGFVSVHWSVQGGMSVFSSTERVYRTRSWMCWNSRRNIFMMMVTHVYVNVDALNVSVLRWALHAAVPGLSTSSYFRGAINTEICNFYRKKTVDLEFLILFWLRKETCMLHVRVGKNLGKRIWKILFGYNNQRYVFP